jgi:hypothetical protein
MGSVMSVAYGADIKLDADLFDALGDAYGRSPTQTKLRIEKRLVPALKKRLLTRLQTYPPPKKDSKYKRTGRLKRGWVVEVVINEYGGEIGASNAVDYTIYVQGELQRDFHAETGWEKLDDPILETAIFAQDQIIDIWEEVTAVQDMFGRR